MSDGNDDLWVVKIGRSVFGRKPEEPEEPQPRAYEGLAGMTRVERMKLFGSYIKLYRETIGISGRELARRCDMSSSSISKIERGEHMVFPETLATICQALNMDNELITAMGRISEPDMTLRFFDTLTSFTEGQLRHTIALACALAIPKYQSYSGRTSTDTRDLSQLLRWTGVKERTMEFIAEEERRTEAYRRESEAEQRKAKRRTARTR
jgi:transcriptional regulator with XRE-family HTH domain